MSAGPNRTVNILLTPHAPIDPVEVYRELWTHGATPDIQGFLSDLPRISPSQTVDLFLIDQRERWRLGDRVLVEVYIGLMPDLVYNLDLLKKLVITEYRLRKQSDEPTSLLLYEERFPSLSGILQEELSRVDQEVGIQADPPSFHLNLAQIVSDAGDLTPNMPRAVGEYEILRELGRGGMGTVYLARHKNLKRLVALKVISSQGQSAADVTRFQTEVEAIARMQHPNIVQIYEVGQHQGMAFCALEYVPGGTLSHLLKGTPLPLDQAAHLVETLARAIHAAHQQNIIHRDLKPGNVLLSPKTSLAGNESREDSVRPPEVWDPDRWTVKITDFGLAKRLDDDQGLTRTGDIVGTPAYMAPEQAAGKVFDTSPATDVYALGVMLYEMLTGAPPFRAATSLLTIAQVLTKTPNLPTSIRPGIPRPLEVICLKCLEKEPRNRYPSAEALASDLARFLSKKAIKARPAALLVRLYRQARQRPLQTTVLAGLTIGVAVAVGIGIDVAQKRAENYKLLASTQQTLVDALDAAESDRWTEADRLLEQADRLLEARPAATGELRGRLAEAKAKVVRRKQAKERFARLTQLREEAIFHQLPLNRSETASFRQNADGAARAALKLYGIGEPGTTAMEIDAPDLHDDERAKIRAACYELMLILAGPGEPGHDPESARAALAVLDQAPRIGHPLTRIYFLRRADWEEQAHNGPAAAEARRHAAEVGGRATESVAQDEFWMGIESFQHANPPRAREHFLRALAIEPDHFWAHFGVAVSALNKEESGATAARYEAVDHLSFCIRARREFVWGYILRAIAYSELQQFKQAEDDFGIAERLAPAGDAHYALRVNRGTVRFFEKHYDEALDDLSEAVRLPMADYQAYGNRAQVNEALNRTGEALEDYSEALRRASGSPAEARLRRSRGYLSLKLGKPTAALQDFTAATRVESPGNPRRADDFLMCGRILHDLGSLDQAVEAYNLALEIRPRDSTGHRLRGRTLVAMKEWSRALESLNVCVTASQATADVYLYRGLARSSLQDYVGAYNDFNMALTAPPSPDEPKSSILSRVQAHRGWTLLGMGRKEDALLAFEQVVNLDPGNSEGYLGRGTARVKLPGLYKQGLRDTEEALRLGTPSARSCFLAAKTHASAAFKVERDDAEPRRVTLAREYRERAVNLLREAVEHTPAPDRPAFWTATVEKDDVFAPLERVTGFKELAEEIRAPEKKIKPKEPVKQR